MSGDPAPLIVAAVLGGEDQAWLDRLRRAYYPPDHNRVAAHLTLFRHLPPSLERELKQRLAGVTRDTSSPRADAAGPMGLGSGVAIRIVSPELEILRHELADAFRGLLMPQDSAGWRPHVTIQNKVSPHEARRLQRTLERDFTTRPIRVAGLGVWRYRGAWEPVSRHLFGR